MTREEFGSAGRWTFAVVASVALHAVLLTGLGLGSDSSDETVPVAETPAAPVPAVEPKSETGAPSPQSQTTDSRPPTVVPAKRSVETNPSRSVKPAVERPTTPPSVATTLPPAAKTHAAPPAPSAAANTTTYVVVAGDTLTALSARFGCTPADLARLNKKSVSRLKNLWVGQKIKFPASKSP